MWERWFVRTNQRFVAIHAPIRGLDDGLERHPEAPQRLLETRLERRKVTQLQSRPRLVEDSPSQFRQAMYGGPALNGRHQSLGLDWLLQIAKGTELNGKHGAVHVWHPRHQDHGDIQVALSNRAQEVDTTYAWH